MIGRVNRRVLLNSRHKNNAFTIVELLVVIVVIGILAAISIVSYSGITNKAITVALQSDLSNDAKLLKMYSVEHGYYPDSIDSINYCPDAPIADDRYCLKNSNDNVLSYTGGGSSFTLTNTHTPSGLAYSISEDGNIIAVSGGGSVANSFVKAWGGSGSEEGRSIAQTPDGGFLVTGITTSYGTGDSDVLISKYTPSGSLSWTKTWGGSGDDSANAVTKTSDGGFAITGDTTSFGSGDTDAFICKYTSDGTLSWNKIWGGAGSDTAKSIIQSDDDGYVIVGESWSYSAGASDIFIIKYNSDGSLSWNKTWGGTSFEIANSVINTSDGGYALTGYSSSFRGSNNDAVILKYSSTGTLSFAKTWGFSIIAYASSITQTSDDGYVIVGKGCSGSCSFIAKFTSNGTFSWNKTWGGIASGWDDVHSVINASDGGLIVVGETADYNSDWQTDAYIAKFTSEGIASWYKTWGNSGAEGARYVVQNSDNSYIATGYTDSYGIGDTDLFIAKYTQNGILDNCSSPKCLSVNLSMSTPSAINGSPTATTSSPSVAESAPTAIVKTPTLEMTVIVPTDPFTVTTTFSGQELYIAWPGNNQTVCKEWTAPVGKSVYGFFVSHATEYDSDYFRVSLDGNEKYYSSKEINDEYIDVSSSPGSILSACMETDGSVQDGYGGQVTGAYYK